MKVFKFGGASVRDANSIRRVGEIIQTVQGQLVVVVSAMGKSTNALEAICNGYFYKRGQVAEQVDAIEQYHSAIVAELFGSNDAEAQKRVSALIDELRNAVSEAPSLCYDFEYDRIVSFGERISTAIVSEYLNSISISNKLVDIRTALKTDDNYRDANINIELSGELCKEVFTFDGVRCYITQGFIAGTTTNQTTTLGREGSDYTAAILANLLDAEGVTIWKDVPGVMSADPKCFADAQVLPRISYKEAVELSYCGAQVIHPKTIKPIQNKTIPLYVKSFVDYSLPGTIIGDVTEHIDMPPVIIVKPRQLLLTLTPHDFSFIAEEKLSHIFALFAKYRLKLHLIQLSAIKFTFLTDFNEQTFTQFVGELQAFYEVRYNADVSLLTVRHYTDAALQQLLEGKKVLVEQRSRLTARFVINQNIKS